MIRNFLKISLITYWILSFYLQQLLYSQNQDIEVYFYGPNLKCQKLDSVVVNFLSRAVPGDVVYMAIYNLNRQNIKDAIIDTLNRIGKENFYLIFEKSNEKNFQDIIGPRKVTNWCDDNTTGSSYLMHNKFIVIKNKAVLTGSYNFTDESTEFDNNNIVIINSSEVAKCYEEEFLYMYENKKFGPYKNTTSPTWNGKEIIINPSCRIKIYFSPYTFPETISSAIINALRKIKETFYFAIYILTGNTEIDEEIINLMARGVEICGITELEQVSQVYYSLREKGIKLLVDGNRGSMHHKFAILDIGSKNSVTITGSYNWTFSADNYNDENILFIHSTEIGKKFYEEFLSLYENAVGGRNNDTIIVAKSAISDIMDFIIYPSPAVNANYVNFGFKVSSRVKELKINIYTLSGIKIKEIPIESFYAHFYNEFTYHFDKENFLPSDLYLVTLESIAYDGCRSTKTKKLLVMR